MGKWESGKAVKRGKAREYDGGMAMDILPSGERLKSSTSYRAVPPAAKCESFAATWYVAIDYVNVG